MILPLFLGRFLGRIQGHDLALGQGLALDHAQGPGQGQGGGDHTQGAEAPARVEVAVHDTVVVKARASRRVGVGLHEPKL